jgi:hypothetical protein
MTHSCRLPCTISLASQKPHFQKPFRDSDDYELVSDILHVHFEFEPFLIARGQFKTSAIRQA